MISPLSYLEIIFLKVTISMYDAAPSPPDSELDFPRYARMLCSQHLVWDARVRVLDGSSRRLVGQIVDVNQSVATLWFCDDGTVSPFPLSALELHFEHGDSVKIVCGKHKGHCGRVRSIADMSSLDSQDAKIVVFLSRTLGVVRCRFLAFINLTYAVSGHHLKELSHF